MSSYSEVIDYLYRAAPLFQNIGAGAYKEGLSNTLALDEHFGHPHRRYRTIHVAGTNGKGSVSSMLAAILQEAGLRVGLYTSPHLEDFRERIRVNGEMISEQRVIDFVEQERAFFEPLYPSFFELTTALAFLYFAEQEIDVAVVEVGLGGRLDCTNIIQPDLSVITNISFDHQQFLGDTLAQIAGEKAGIIKAGVPVVIGESKEHEDPSQDKMSTSRVREVFVQVFNEKNSPDSSKPSLRFADEEPRFSVVTTPEAGEESPCQLKGDYQRANMQTVLCAVDELRRQPFYCERLTADAVREGLAHVCDLTGLRGRWQVVGDHPLTICDVGHNAAGIEQVVQQLSAQPQEHLRIVFGMVGDKDYHKAMELMAALRDRAELYVTQPTSERALPAATLAEAARQHGLRVRVCEPSIKKAIGAARADAHPDDLLFIGGSCYLIADYFTLC